MILYVCGSEGGNDVVHGRLPIPIIKLDLGSEYLDLGSEYLDLGSEYLYLGSEYLS